MNYQNSKFVNNDILKHLYTNRIVEIWNSLPDYVVEVNIINIFENRLNKHWRMQNISFMIVNLN